MAFLVSSSANCNYFVPYNSSEDFVLLPKRSLLRLPPLRIVSFLWELPARMWRGDSTIQWDDVVHVNLAPQQGEGAFLGMNAVPSNRVSLCALHVLPSINICECVLRKGIMVRLVGNFHLEEGPSCGDLHVALLITGSGPQLIAKATWDLFLDCNLTPIFQLSWYRLAALGTEIWQKPNYFISSWYSFPPGQNQRTSLHLLCGMVAG